MIDEQKHDDGCRCLACCREKFKTIDPARFGKAPVAPIGNPFAPQRLCNHVLYAMRGEAVRPDE